MNCPKCNSVMEKVTYQNIEVDRCTGCQGIWFDLLEHKQLKSMAGSEKIDIGSARTKPTTEAGNINCPVCQTRMTRLVDVTQPHIQYENCPVCYGIFFDAGEFKDYKAETILDFFRDLSVKERQ